MKILKTERRRLRRRLATDLDHLFALYRDPDLRFILASPLLHLPLL